MALTNAQLSADIAALIASVDDWQKTYSAWLGGTATGGPNNDGRYPLKNAVGVVALYHCPAALASTVTGPSEAAASAAAAAEHSRLAAEAAATLATTKATFANAATVAGQAARDLTFIYRNEVEGMHSNVSLWAGRVSANAATAAANTVIIQGLAANVANSANSAALSASNAANSANIAATFNPANFAPIVHSHAANAITTGTFAAARMPAYTGDVTSPSGSTVNTLPTVNANTGSFGSATASPVFTVNAKGLITAVTTATVTPAWTSVTGKPTTISGYGITDLIASITALDASKLTGTLDPARLPSTVFQAPIVAASNIASLTTAQQNEIRIGSTVVTSEGMFWSYLGGTKTLEASYRAMADTTPDWGSIGNKPLDFTPSAHSHAWTDITSGKPTTLAGYGITDAAISTHTHTFASLTSKPTTLAGYGITDAAQKSNPTFTGTLTAAQTVVSSVAINTGLLYADGNHTVVKTGASGAEKYWRFDSNGIFYSLNGGITAGGNITTAGGHLVTTVPGVAMRMKDSATASGRAALHYKDAANYYMLLTNDADADGGFNALRPFMINLTSGLVSMGHSLGVTGYVAATGNVSAGGTLSATSTLTVGGSATVNGSYLEVGAGSASVSPSGILRKGSLELRDTNPYIDLTRDSTSDWHARIQSNANGILYVYSQAALNLEAMNGGVVRAYGGNGVQAGNVLTENGGDQTLSKGLAFPSTGGFTTTFTSALEARGPGGSAAGSEATMKFHRPGVFGSVFGIGTDNQYRHGGWSEGDVSYRFWTEKNLAMSYNATANTGALRDGAGSLNATCINTPAADGNGIRFWNGDFSYSIYMSAETAAGNVGGRPANSSASDYNMYFKMSGGNRGFVFKYGDSPVAKINNAGDFHGSRINANEWYYTYGGGGFYDSSTGQGIRSAGSSGHPYGTMSAYGNGSNGWQGFNLRNDGVVTWMCNGDTVGMHHSSNSWLIVGNMSGDFTFRGNVTAYSDLRLKTKVRPIPDVAARRDNLARAAIMYEREGRTRIGYGAQTVREGNPEFVHEADDAMKLADGTGTLSVDYGETTAVLAAASKLTDERVAYLTTIIAGLEARITQLESKGV